MDTLNKNTLNTSDNCIEDWQDSCFVEIFDITEIQRLQDMFADAHGVASLITDITGNPITKPSNFSHFCENIIRKTELGCANCFKSDAILGSYNPKAANVQQCLSGGLWDAGASITVGGKHIANWLIGQVRNEDVDIKKLMQYANEIGADSDDYKAAFEKVPVMSTDKFTKIANLLFVIANELSEKAYSNLQLRKQIDKSELAHKLLKESEERFQLLFNKAPLGYQSLDINGCFIEVNQQWLDTLGYERHEVVGKWFGDFLTPMFQDGFRERFPIFKAQGHIHSEFEMLHKNGGIRFIAFDGKIGTDIEGNFKQTHCILQDVTESKRTLDALKESEELHRTILQTAMDGFWLVGDDGRLLEVNEAYCKMSGYSEVELLGMRIADVEAVENKTDVNDRISKIKKLQADRFETKHKRKDGFIYDVEITVKYIANEKFVVFIRDITETKNAKTALLDAEWKFKALFELGPIGVAYHRMMYDEAGAPIDYYFIDANASYKELTGVNPVGMTVRQAFPGIENDPADWIGIFGNVAKTGQTFRIEQFLQSNERWYDCVAYQYKPDHFVAAFTEITQRKAAEAQLQSEKLRLALIIEGTNAATWEWNVQTGATIFNERWAEMIGYTLEELMPISIETWAKFAHPDDFIIATELLNKHFAGELDYYETETRMRHKNGDWVWVLDRGRVHTWTEDRKPLLMSGTQQGITERKNAELKLTESESKYRLLAENTTDIIWVLNITNNQYTYISPSIFQLRGITVEEAMIEAIEDSLTAESLVIINDLINADVARLLENPNSPIDNTVEVQQPCKDGTIIWVEISTRLRYNLQKEIEVIGVSRDITERKKVEVKLKESEERNASIISGTAEGIVVVDIETNLFTHANSIYCRMLGYTEDELKCLRIIDTHPAEFSDYVLKEMDAHIKGDTSLAKNLPTLRKDGSLFYADIMASPITFNNRPSIVGFLVDVTERKNAEDALRENEERFRATFEQAAVGIAQVGVDGKWLRVNQRLCEIVGYEHDELFAITFQDITHKDDLKKDLDNFDQLLAGEINNYSIEKRYIKKNGTHVWVNLTVGLVRDALNAPKYFVSVVEDITERKNAELMLENQRELYLDLVNTQPAGIYRIRVFPKESWENDAWEKTDTPPYKMELISDRFCEILEITPELFERHPGIVIDLVHPDDKEVFIRKNDEANTTVRTFSLDCRLLINNNLKWIHFESLPRKLENGDILYTGIIYDITEQKIAHEKLQDSEIRFRKILQDVDSLAVQGYATDGTVQYWNKASELMYGYTAEEAIGKSFVDLIVSPDMRESALQNYLQLAETCQSIPASEYSFMRKDGSLVSVLTNHAIVQIAGQPRELFCIDFDLTERKKAEEALRKSEEMMRTSQSVAHICSYSTNLKVDDIAKSAWTCSPEFYEIFGIDNTYPHTIEGWVGFIHPDFRDEMVAYHEYVIKEKIRFDHEYKIIRINDGAERWVYGTGKLEFDENGNPIRMYGAIQDITERKKVEIALRESETQYRNLANAGLSLTWRSGTDKLCNYFNDTWLKFTGRTLEQEMGNGWTEGVHPDDFDRCVTTYVTAFDKHEAFEMEYRLRHVSGEYRWILDLGTPNYNSKNEFIGYIGNCFDITERKQSEEDFRNLIELSPVPMAIIRDWKTIYFNPSAVELFGASTQNEILNKHINEFIHPDYHKLAFENSKTIAQNGYVEMQEQKYIKLDGSILDVETQAKRIRFNDAPATLVVINDITKRKQAEEKEKELLNRLELISFHLPGVIYQFRRRTDGTFHFPYASPGIFKIYGVMPKDVEHDASTAFTTIYPDDLDRVSASINYSAETLTPWHDIYRVNQPSGTTVWVEGNSTPQKLDDGSIIWHGYIQDITERKNAEVQLQHSELMLKTVLDNFPGIVFWKDVHSNFLGSNLEFALAAGLKNTDEVIGLSDYDLPWTRTEADNYRADDAEVMRLKMEKLHIIETQLRSDGSSVWLDTSKVPFTNEKNEVIGVIGVATDITERKKTEEALQKNQKLLSDTEKIGKVGGWEFYIDTFEKSWTKETFDIHELPYDYDTTLENAVDFYTPESLPIIQNALKLAAEKGEEFDVELEIITAKANRKFVHIIGKTDMEARRVYGFFQDITDRKKAEEALRESEEKLRALFSAMTEMVVMNELVFDENGQAIDYMIYDCNNAYVKLMGKAKENIVGKRASELYKKAKMSFLDEYATVVISGETLEHSYYHEPFDKHFLVSAISTEKNKFAIILKDITELKKMYELIDLKNKELENYIYVASHDLRSPLVNIQGFSQRLQKQTNQIAQIATQLDMHESLEAELAKITADDIPKSLSFILNNVSKMDTLISGLLQVSRTGRVAINPSALNMNDLFKTILRVFDYQLNERKAKLILHELDGCFGDANQLNQLFSNIISNAIKYSDSNRALVIEIASVVKYNKVLYSIKDNGIGIAQKQMSKIWDIFYRANSSAEVLGDGIGLSIAKQITDKHNGKIWAESFEGEGTTFFVELFREGFLENKE